MNRILLLAAFLVLHPALPAQTATSLPPSETVTGEKIDASAAIEKKDAAGKFQRMHQAFLARGKEGPIGVLFLGDSITERWVSAPHIWNRYYAPWQPANFGIGGDETHHVIWRIENGELDGIHPKVVVLMLGTNNTLRHDADQIAAAMQKIIGLIQAKIPETKILLLAVFPRGPRRLNNGTITDSAREVAAKRIPVIAALNQKLAKFDDGTRVRFLDVGAQFLGQDGKVPFSIMPDQVHPSPAGYQLWAEAMQPLLTEMMR